MAIKDNLTPVDELENFTTDLPSNVSPEVKELQPGLNSMMKFPLPPSQVSPDSLRQFYRGGQVPQRRLLAPPTTPIVGANSLFETGVSTTSSGSTTIIEKGLEIKQASVTSNVVGEFISPIILGKAFQCLYITANGACRIELYGSQQDAILDSYRAIDVPPLAGTTQGLIFDLVLDTAPFVWGFSNVIGCNLENPVTNLAYIAITNIGTQFPVTVSMSYIPLVN